MNLQDAYEAIALTYYKLRNYDLSLKNYELADNSYLIEKEKNIILILSHILTLVMFIEKNLIIQKH